MNCFPNWLQRITAQRYGPNYQGDIPYPVYQVQPAVLDAANSVNSGALQDDAFYQNIASTVPIANIATTIIHVMPMNPYDTINICAFPFAATAGVPDIATPIFFSFNKPGRIISEAQIQGSPEAFLCTCAAFNPAEDFSSYPTCIFSPIVDLNAALNKVATAYVNALYETVKTNRPFYFWFNDGIATPPSQASTTAIGFNATWYVQGR